MADADAVIRARRVCHHRLVTTVAAFDQRCLTRPSANAEWDVAQVLGHLGSGAEIGLAGLDAARSATPRDHPVRVGPLGRDAPREMPRRVRDLGQRLVASYETLDDATRARLRIKLGFFPRPMDVQSVGAFRLSEFALHSWDVRVGRDPNAALAPPATELLVDRLALSIGFFAQPDALPHPVTLGVNTVDPDRIFALSTVDGVTLQPGTTPNPDGTVTLGAGALVRLVTGRLGHHRAGVRLDSASRILDDLCRVFPATEGRAAPERPNESPS